MAIFKCKMCGGTLEIQDGSTVAECIYCGTKQTIPRLDDERRANLYDRANHFRRNNDYDKAMAIYEQLLEADRTDAEAYWSILLCKYGVEYVEDPGTHKIIPTINRAQYTSIFADEDYKSAMEYADGYQRDIYETEAKQLDTIQKGILAISQKEKPYDIFICYKETDANGRRTQDSVLAQDLYYQLTNEGYKVFFSRITLEDKLGTAYEPYIFAALNSAKVMVVLGTNRDNLSSVWVKNEWSRFLALIKKDHTKVLIPAFRDMDPYDLPEEFSHLQAQDMGKLGFMQDLIRGIKKIISANTQKTIEKETVVQNNVNIAPLLKRAIMCCEDKDFSKADELAEQILNLDPEFAAAYVIKLLVNYQVRKLDAFKTFGQNISSNPNLQRAIKFASGDLKEQLSAIKKENAEYSKCFPIYSKALANFKDKHYEVAMSQFVQIPDFKDSADLYAQCKTELDLANKEKMYQAAYSLGFSEDTTEEYIEQAIKKFRSLNNYKKSVIYADKLQAKLDKIRYDKQVAAEKERVAKEKRKKLIKKVSIISAIVVIVLVVVITLTCTVFVPAANYNKAKDMIKNDDFKSALQACRDLDGFGKSDEIIPVLENLVYADNLCKKGEFVKASKWLIDVDAKVTINFDSKGGQVSEDKQEEKTTIIYDKTINIPSPIMDGARFVDWKLDGYDIDYDLKNVTAQINVYAVWQFEQYSINCDLDGGVAENLPKSYTKDEEITLPTPTKKGYTFLGWTSTDWTEMRVDVVIPKGSMGEKGYKANWQANEYVVRFDANGGSVAIDQKTVTFGEDPDLPIPEFKGNKFLGWYWSQGTKKFDSDVWDIDSTVTLIAKWDVDVYTVTYVLNGGKNASSNVSSYTINNAFSLSEPTKTGYTFLGWSGTDISGVSKSVSVAKNSVGNRTYTANWQANTYTITYNPNGGTMSSTTQSVVYDELFGLYTTIYTGYKFLGWYKNNVELFELTTGTWNISDDVNLTAHWIESDEIVYTVNHHLENANDSGYTLINSEILYGTTSERVTPDVKSYDNFVSPSKQSLVVAADGSSELNYYYTRKTYTITIYPNNGASSSSKTFKYQQTLNANTWAERDGYTFGGWYTDAALTTAFTDTTMGDKGLSLYAYWIGETKPYNFTYADTLNKITINGYKGTESNVVIPQYINNHKVTTINGCSSTIITSIEMPNSITKIGEGAFNGCSSLKNIAISDSVTSLPGGLFNGCGSLENMTLPFVGGSKSAATASASTLFGYIFGAISYSGSVAIKQYYSDSNYSTYYIPSSLRNVSILGGNILDRAFQNFSNLTSITLPSTLDVIGTHAFSNCTGLTAVHITDLAAWCNMSFEDEFANPLYYAHNLYFNGELVTNLVIPNSITEIKAYAFAGDLANNIVIPNTVTKIGDFAFLNCYHFTSLEIPNSVISIGRSAFAGCNGLKSMVLPFVGGNKEATSSQNSTLFGYIFSEVNNGGAKIGHYLGSNTITYYIPPYLTNIIVTGGNILYGAFSGCSGLTSVTIPNSVTTINNYAFYGCSGLTNIIIPNSVTSIGLYAFYNCSGLTSVTIGNSVTSIGECAFSGCSGLTSVTIGNSVTSIDLFAFSNCSGLTSITIPDSVTSIGASAFSGCSSLKSITLPFVGSSASKKSGDTYQYPFGYIFGTSSYIGGTSTTQYYYGPSTSSTTYDHYYIPISLKSVTITGGNILRGAFYNCSGLTSITIPNSVTSIGNESFYNCSGLTSITIPDSVTSIGPYAFRDCSGLTSVTIGNSVTSIGSSAFSGCRKLTSVTVPDSVTSIGASAFYGCSKITSITLPFVGGSKSSTSASSSTLFGYIFGTSSYTGGTATKQYYGSSSHYYTTYYIPSTLKSVTITGGNILYGAFYGCSGLTSVTIGNSVTSIGASAFSGCSSLESITLPFVGGSKSATSALSSTLFGYIFGLSSYNGGVETAQYYSSSDMVTYYIPSSLKSVTITGGNILYGAFYGCSGITSITIPDNITSIGDKAFYGCNSLTAVYITDLTAWCNISFGDYSNPLYYGASLYLNGELLTGELVIPDGVTTIPSNAFRGCSDLTSVKIPTGVTSIGSSAFYGCSGLTSVEIPTGVTSIGGRAFEDCSGLTSVTIGNSVTSIGISAFSGCSGLTAVHITDLAAWCNVSSAGTLGLFYSDLLSDGAKLYLNGELLKGDLIIPNTVTKINAYAFYNCSELTSITIPNSVTSIGKYAFYNCSGLTAVHITDLAAWCNISFGSANANPLYYAKNLYLNGELLKGDLVIPDTVTKIPSYAFYNCSGLISVTIPDSVTSIGKSAFSGCSGLTSITIPDSVTSIGDYAFHNCSGLTSATIPDSVESIGSSAFSGCSSLESITLPFVGGSKSATSASKSTLFGYIFGTSSYTGGKETIQRYTNSADAELTYYISTTLKSVTITGGNILPYAFFGCSSLTSVTISDSVTNVGESAFCGCSELIAVHITDLSVWCSISFVNEYANPLYYAHSLYLDGELVTDLIIPDVVTKISAYTFRNCSSLTSIIIGNGVTSIAEGAFSGCSGLTSIALPFVGANVDPKSEGFYYTIHPFGYIFGTNSYVGGTATNQRSYTPASSYQTQFINATYYIPSSLMNVTITGKQISYGAFYNYSNLTSVTICNSVTSIGGDAFNNCRGLTSVIIPDSVTSIGGDAFNGCSNIKYYQGSSLWIEEIEKTELETVVLTGGTSIGNSVFSGCGNLTSVTIPNNVTSIGDNAFYGCSGLTSVTIPDSVTSIGDSVFAWCSGLTSVTIGNSVKSIGAYAFSGCGGLTSITIPDSVTSIGREAFSGCSGLTSITIPDSVTSIGNYAFSGCSKLTSVTVPNSVISIGNYAFSGCSKLTSVTVPNSVISIGKYAFYQCGRLIAVHVTDFTAWCNMSFEDEFANPLYYAHNLYLNGELVTDLVIPDTITAIKSYAFSGCSGLTSITIPDSVTSIGGHAFEYCSGLTSVTIPDSVTSIGVGAFSGCSGLTSVTIPDSVTSIGNYAFSGCSKLTSITIPDSVTSIGNYAFYGCSGLTSITFTDTTTWYRTDNSTDWQNKTGGTELSVTNASTNATNFTDTYINSYWYKL